MREIKFRGKLIDIDKWVYGNYDTSIEDGDNGGIEVYYEEINTLLTYINSQLVYPETVGQYTGLKDKKGAEIYENDIVKYEDTFDECIGIVRFGKWGQDGSGGEYGVEYCLGFYIERVKAMREKNFISDQVAEQAINEEYLSNVSLVQDGIEGIEVIGNIHENP
ncbi:YopX family protein [Clostridium tyrobutyricum]|uniref:YopX family protein n=1 Tax=Clostridium tyrobutyricum TaxID=1519 RepID=UPI001C380571|nr:YopX family protein [Clostridium tyrobutyricum]MBV4429397.1 hypothetical protein [Clostridium tyrobutyricum]MBV4443024.1 hypothetical protein [Clostridium tyrobutyricum]